MKRIQTYLAIVCTGSLLLLKPAASAPPALDGDRYGGVLSLPGPRMGGFHVQQIKGRWFLVTPEGHAFCSLGATHAVECIRLDELNLFKSRYEKSERRLRSLSETRR